MLYERVNPNEVLAHLAHLDLFRALGDAVTAVMTVDVLERHVPAVTDPSTGLHGPVGGVAGQAVRSIVAHGDLMGDLHVVALVELGGGGSHEEPKGGRVGMQFHEGKLDGLIGRQFFPPGHAVVGVADRFVDAVLGRAEGGGRLANAVLMNKVLGQLETVIDPAEDGVGADPDVAQGDLGMISGHIERPPEEVDGEPGRVRWDEEGRDPKGLSGLTRRAGEDDVMRGVVQSGVEALLAVDHPFLAVGHGHGLESGRIGSVTRLRQPERQPAAAVQEAGHPVGLLGLGAEVPHHQDGREVADDAGFLLEVVVESEAAWWPGAHG